MALHSPKQPTALNADFSSPRADPVGSRRSAHTSVKEGHPSKSGYFTDIGASSVKTVGLLHIGIAICCLS